MLALAGPISDRALLRSLHRSDDKSDGEERSELDELVSSTSERVKDHRGNIGTVVVTNTASILSFRLEGGEGSMRIGMEQSFDGIHSIGSHWQWRLACRRSSDIDGSLGSSSCSRLSDNGNSPMSITGWSGCLEDFLEDEDADDSNTFFVFFHVGFLMIGSDLEDDNRLNKWWCVTISSDDRPNLSNWEKPIVCSPLEPDCESLDRVSNVLDRDRGRGERFACGVRKEAGFWCRLCGDIDKDLVAILTEDRGFMHGFAGDFTGD